MKPAEHRKRQPDRVCEKRGGDGRQDDSIIAGVVRQEKDVVKRLVIPKAGGFHADETGLLLRFDAHGYFGPLDEFSAVGKIDDQVAGTVLSFR